MKRLFVLIILLAGSQQTALAECAKDRFGDVYCGRGACAQDLAGNVFCSKYQFGQAFLEENGKVVCGKGQCVESVKFQEFFCSVIENGGANRDRLGEPKCYGGCEKASELMCESEAGR
jgi:hypothetical protein